MSMLETLCQCRVRVSMSSRWRCVSVLLYDCVDNRWLCVISIGDCRVSISYVIQVCAYVYARKYFALKKILLHSDQFKQFIEDCYKNKEITIWSTQHGGSRLKKDNNRLRTDQWVSNFVCLCFYAQSARTVISGRITTDKGDNSRQAWHLHSLPKEPTTDKWDTNKRDNSRHKRQQAMETSTDERDNNKRKRQQQT